ncbi:SLC13 family permease [Cetobacterium sp. SF1]|uniref:SLC13 family permease n=1 Tax=Cetobacterium sp. SF1 TaxID=3417654 RepID=UPI003CF9E06A
MEEIKSKDTEHKSFSFSNDRLKWVGSFGILLATGLLCKKFNLDSKTSIFFMGTLFAILSWCFSFLPDAITGLLLPMIYIVFKIASPGVVLKPWTTTIPWLVLSAMLMSAMLNETGVIKRIALWSMARFGKTFGLILFGITLAGIIITPFIPSVIAKIVIFNIITMGLIETLDYKPKSLEATLITMAGFFVISTFRLGFATGDSGIVIGLNYAQEVTGKVLTWMEYLIHNLPYIILYTFGSLGVLIFLGRKITPISKEKRNLLKKNYEDLGKVKGKEKVAFIIMGIVLLTMATESFHGVNSAWALVIITSLFFLPKLNLLNGESLKKINFLPLLFIVGAMSIGNVAEQTQAIDLIKKTLEPFFKGSTFSVIAMSYLTGILLNFLLTPLAALSSFSLPLIQLGIEGGINPYVMTYIFQVALDQYLLPYEFAGLLLVYTSGYISLKLLVKILLIRMALGLIILLVGAYPLWNFLGILLV